MHKSYFDSFIFLVGLTRQVLRAARQILGSQNGAQITKLSLKNNWKIQAVFAFDIS